MVACKQEVTKDVERGTIAMNGAVSSAHPLASQIGVDILRKGGNAYDAGVAVQFALAVAYPRAGNIGGGGFAVIRTSEGEVNTLDFREKAPLAAHEKMYLDEKDQPIKNLSVKGHLAVGVPGSVAGMVTLHEKYGRLPFKVLLKPAIELAENGVVLTDAEAKTINRYHDLFREVNPQGFVFTTKDVWEQGDHVTYPALAKTLKLIQENGRDGFYKGKTAEGIVGEMKQGGGIITLEDLEKYEAVWRKPLKSSFRVYNIISMGPPSSGGVALLQLLEGWEQLSNPKWKHNSTESIHLMTELERRVYADRATFMGDADFVDIPITHLLDSSYLENRFASISNEKATDSQIIKAGEVERIESYETTHFSIVDKEGNALSITTTLNGNFGSKVFVKEGGFFLNNEMDDFSIKPGVPNQFGLVGGKANAISPEKRMLSSMTPTIVEKGDDLFMVVGTPGGSTIITSVFQTILNVTDFGMTMQEAVNAPKLHSQWLPDKIVYEKGKMKRVVLDELKAMGHVLDSTTQIGRMDCILRLEDGSLEGASDRTRSDGVALGY